LRRITAVLLFSTLAYSQTSGLPAPGVLGNDLTTNGVFVVNQAAGGSDVMPSGTKLPSASGVGFVASGGNPATISSAGTVRGLCSTDGTNCWVAAPASATSTGTPGQKAYDSGFLYVCISTNVWRRVALSTF
jgi:hypothetical protein